jgi:hypothetical protein
VGASGRHGGLHRITSLLTAFSTSGDRLGRSHIGEEFCNV